MTDNPSLWGGIEDIVYAWSIRAGEPYNTLVGELYDYVLKTYGPPF